MFSTTSEDPLIRKKRKEEAKLLKRKRIEESGGKRPRIINDNKDDDSKKKKIKKMTPQKKNTNNNKNNNKKQSAGVGGKFGRVMEEIPCRNKPRSGTLSIAIPGSIVSNCQTKELKTHLVGQIARAAAIYHVDEIIVYDDKLSKKHNNYSHRSFKQKRDEQNENYKKKEDEKRKEKNKEGDDTPKEEDKESEERPKSLVDRPRFDPHVFMARILQYCECPQYMRRHFFPMHFDLQFVGLLSPLDAPHHVRAEDRSPYREGLVMDIRNGKSSNRVNCGIWNRPVAIDRELKPGIRCTVKIDVEAYGSAKALKGVVVSPSAPRETDGTYWGYTTRVAQNLTDVFKNCPFDSEEYDLKIGTSERGDHISDDDNNNILRKKIRNNTSSSDSSNYKHALIVFGGVAGIEECVDADELCKLPGNQSKKLFDLWINICPFQGSRTIRTEEAVLIGLARLAPTITEAVSEIHKKKNIDSKKEEVLEFSDKDVSDEDDDGDVSEEDSEA
mmetsp:Transcript_16539/g.18372  ORF Transcript_16539/g.18372 Transcript_16539/m.18372 type:complete len:500 (+) Transcript_16539:127-1626(+)